MSRAIFVADSSRGGIGDANSRVGVIRKRRAGGLIMKVDGGYR
jgi:hypothetical protein